MADEIGKLFLERKIKAAIQKFNSTKPDKAISQLVEVGEPAANYLITSLKDKNYKVRKNSAISLGRIKSKKAIAPLLRAISDDENPEVQDSAVMAMATIGYPAMKTIITMLEEDDELGEEKKKGMVKVLDNMETAVLTKNQQAVYQLAKGNFAGCSKLGEAAVPCLIKALTKGDEALKEKAETTLLRIGIGALPGLTDSLFSPNDKLREMALNILEKMDINTFHNTEKAAYYLAKGDIDKCVEFETSAITPLLKALEDNRPEVVQAGLKGLKKLDKMAVSSLIKELKGRKRKTKSIIARLLGEIGDKKAVDVLISCLSDMDTKVRINAAQSLCDIGDTKAIPFIINKALLDKDKKVRTFTGERLKKMGQIIAPSLIKILKDEKSSQELKEIAVKVLGEIKAESSVKVLTGVMLDGKGKLRELAALSLGDIGSEKAVEPLIKVLADAKELSGWQRGFNATVSLGKIRDVRAVEPLITIFLDENYLPQLQGAAAEALGNIGDKKVIDELIKGLENKKIQREVIKAIGKLGNPGGIEPLLKIFHSEDSSSLIKSLVIEALGNIGDYSASEDIIKALKEKKLQLKAVEAVGKIREEKAIPEIEEILFNRETDVKLRRACVNTIINIKKRESITSMFKVLKNKTVDLDLKKLIVKSLPEMGETIIKPVIKELKEDEENLELNKYLINILGNLKSSKAVLDLQELLEISRNEIIKTKVAEALGNIRDEESIKTLLEALKNKETSVFVRKSSLISLINMENEALIPLLIKIIDEEESDFRTYTVSALRQMGVPLYEEEEEKK